MRILLLIPYVAFTVIGGRDVWTLQKYHIPFAPRFWKRYASAVYLSSVICVYSVVVHHFHWFYLLSVISFLAGNCCSGYGNDSGVVWREVFQRVLSAFASTLPSLVFVLISHNYWLFLAQLVLALVVKVTMNFVKVPAPIEEGLINFFDSVLKPFLV